MYQSLSKFLWNKGCSTGLVQTLTEFKMLHSAIFIGLTMFFANLTVAGTTNSIRIEDIPKDSTTRIIAGVPYEFDMSSTARQMAFGDPVVQGEEQRKSLACMSALGLSNHFFPTTYKIENYLRFHQSALEKLGSIIQDHTKFLFWFKRIFVQAMQGEARQNGRYRLPFLDSQGRPHFVVFKVGDALGREDYANRRVVDIIAIEEPISIQNFQEFGRIVNRNSVLK